MRKGNIPEQTLTIFCVKTDKGCFISDCAATGGYDYNYHTTAIKDLLFDGKKASPAYCANWYFIEKYPDIIQQECRGQVINRRYELADKALESDKLPGVISEEDRDNYSEGVLDSLYIFKYDREPDYLADISCDIQILCEVEDYRFPPMIDYSAIEQNSWSNTQYKIKNASAQHQMIDKIMFPEVLLHERPCKFTSKQMYDITRQYVLEHIDNSVAKVTSNYDFCFSVRKLVPLIEPETVTYSNIFARTKRERNKIRTSVKKYDEKTIFEMTDDRNKYKGYPVIPEMCANNETELKEKVDTWLEGLMEIINTPLCQCPHCKGSGYLDEIKKEGFDYDRKES